MGKWTAAFVYGGIVCGAQLVVTLIFGANPALPVAFGALTAGGVLLGWQERDERGAP